MISYTVGINNLHDFNAWSGGRQWLETFKEHPEAMDYLDSYLEYCSQERIIEGNPPLTDTDINDFLWFDALDILVEEGYVDRDLNWTDDEWL